jgi:hypothetical protein
MSGNGEGEKVAGGTFLGEIFNKGQTGTSSEEPIEGDAGDASGLRVDPVTGVKRKRGGWKYDADGRPYRGTKSDDGAETESQGDAPRGRKKPEALVIALGELTEILGFVHLSLAATFKAPELVLQPDECDRLAQSVSKVLRHYTVPLASQKTKDWFMLGIVAWGIYKPRISDISVRKHMERKKVVDAAREAALRHAEVPPS